MRRTSALALRTTGIVQQERRVRKRWLKRADAWTTGNRAQSSGRWGALLLYCLLLDCSTGPLSASVEMPPRECSARSRLEIPLERQRLPIIREGDGHHQLPRSVLRGVRQSPGIVPPDSRADIRGRTNVSLIRIAQTLEKVDVGQQRPPSLVAFDPLGNQASAGTSLRPFPRWTGTRCTTCRA